MNKDCHICGSKAIKKVTTSESQGYFFICEKDVCKVVLKNKLFNLGKDISLHHHNTQS